MTAVMKKSTEDILRRSVEDTPVAAVVTVMTTGGINLSSGTGHPGIYDDVRGDGNGYALFCYCQYRHHHEHAADCSIAISAKKCP